MAQSIHLKRHGNLLYEDSLHYQHYDCNNSTDGCNPEKDTDYGVWPETLPGYTATLPCPCADILHSLAGRATRLCHGTYSSGAEWEDVDDTQCSTRLSTITAKLCNIPRVS